MKILIRVIAYGMLAGAGGLIYFNWTRLAAMNWPLIVSIGAGLLPFVLIIAGLIMLSMVRHAGD